jgi:hypothetical protein
VEGVPSKKRMLSEVLNARKGRNVKSEDAKP